MNQKWIVLTQGGGDSERPDQKRACGPFDSEQEGWDWLVAKFGEGVMEACADYLDPQVVLIEDPTEY
ncbi:MAG: hypothetical protein ACYS7Y_20205 [Planctomycetota bacterium]|jgi:hypothetical protein